MIKTGTRKAERSTPEPLIFPKVRFFSSLINYDTKDKMGERGELIRNIIPQVSIGAFYPPDKPLKGMKPILTSNNLMQKGF